MKKILVIDNTIDPPHGSPEIREQLELASGSSGSIQVVTVRAPEDQLPQSVDEFSGVVISGSKTRIEETQPWIEKELDFIRMLYAKKIPTLGICYGEQMIVRALGGQKMTGAAKVAEYGWVKVEQCEAAKNSPILKGLPQSFYSYEAHSDEVYSLPKGFVLTAKSMDCPIQAYDVSDAPMWGIQFHPERGLAEGNKALDRRIKENPNFRAINRQNADQLFDPNVSKVIFLNFLKLVRAAN